MGGALYESFEELIFLTEQNEKHFHLQNEISVGSFYPHHGKIGEHIQLKKDGPFKNRFILPLFLTTHSCRHLSESLSFLCCSN